MVDNKIVSEGEMVKFNMGLATLENIRNLLNFYHKISVMDSISLDGRSFQLSDTLEIQIMKSRVCNQLLIASRPLLNDLQKKKLENEIKKTAVKVQEFKDSFNKIVKVKKVFSYSVDKACDDFISLLEDLLQDNKVFMPGKGESSLF